MFHRCHHLQLRVQKWLPLQLHLLRNNNWLDCIKAVNSTCQYMSVPVSWSMNNWQMSLTCTLWISNGYTSIFKMPISTPKSHFTILFGEHHTRMSENILVIINMVWKCCYFLTTWRKIPWLCTVEGNSWLGASDQWFGGRYLIMDNLTSLTLNICYNSRKLPTNHGRCHSPRDAIAFLHTVEQSIVSEVALVPSFTRTCSTVYLPSNNVMHVHSTPVVKRSSSALKTVS